MFAQLYALLVEENRTTQRTVDGGSGPAVPNRGADAFFNVRVRVAPPPPVPPSFGAGRFRSGGFEKRHEKRGRERKRKG